MKQILQVTLCCLLLLCPGPANAAACIDGYPSTDEKFASSTYVVVAKVIAVEKNAKVSFSYKGKSYDDLVDHVSVRVTRFYKGKASRVLVFDNPHDSAAFPVNIGSAYLIFFEKEDETGKLFIDTCGPSGALTKLNDKTIRRVEELATKRR